MQIFMLLLVIVISSCAPIKYSHDYFLDCEDKHSDFKSLSSCAFEEIKKDCEDKPDCKLSREASAVLTLAWTEISIPT